MEKNKKSDKKELITDAVIRVLQKENYQTMKTAQIAIQAGVSEGTLYKYFKNKKEMFIEAFTRQLGILFTGVFENLQKENSLKKNLDLMGENFYSVISDITCTFVIYNKAYSEAGDPEIKEILKASLGQVTDRIKEVFIWAEEKGEIKPGFDFDLLVLLLWGASEIFMKKYMIDYQPKPEKEEMTKVIDFIYSSIQ